MSGAELEHSDPDQDLYSGQGNGTVLADSETDAKEAFQNQLLEAIRQSLRGSLDDRKTF